MSDAKAKVSLQTQAFLDGIPRRALDKPVALIRANSDSILQSYSPRESFAILYCDMVGRLATASMRRPQVVRKVRDIWLSLRQISQWHTVADARSRLEDDYFPNALEETPNFLNLLEQIDAQLGTKYAVRGWSEYQRIALFLFDENEKALSGKERKVISLIEEKLASMSAAGSKRDQGRVPKSKQVKDKPTYLKQLNALVGLAQLKLEIVELVNFLEIQHERKLAGHKAVNPTYNLIFSGNPGTGKTTVARLLAGIYSSLGFLSRGQLIEADRSTLVGGYLGQTAIKVRETVESAIGGVLFIDEAYSLVADTQDSYGQEAVNTLLKLMEDNREDLVVIAAGYTDGIIKFVNSNPGLKSRFTKHFHFSDYDSTQLRDIFCKLCRENGFTLEKDAHLAVEELMSGIYSERSAGFGNARDVRTLFERTIQNQANRLVKTKNRSKDDLNTLVVADIPRAYHPEVGKHDFVLTTM